MIRIKVEPKTYTTGEVDICKSGVIYAILEDAVSLDEVGHLRYSFHDGVKYSPALRIDNLEVENDQKEFQVRRKGIGTKLEEKLCEIAKQCNIHYIEGYVEGKAAFKLRNKVFGKPKRKVGDLRKLPLHRPFGGGPNKVFVVSAVKNCLL